MTTRRWLIVTAVVAIALRFAIDAGRPWRSHALHAAAVIDYCAFMETFDTGTATLRNAARKKVTGRKSIVTSRSRHLVTVDLRYVPFPIPSQQFAVSKEI